jgi:hypothetical protein
MMPPSINTSPMLPPRLMLSAAAASRVMNALEEGLSHAAARLETAAHDQAAKRPADLYSDRRVSMGDDAVELSAMNPTGTNFEPARAEPEGLDRPLHLEFAHRPDIYKADGARSMRGELCLGNPTPDITPVTEHHVVRPERGHRAAVANLVDMRTREHEHAAGDQVGGAGRELAITQHRSCLETADAQPSPAIAGGAADAHDAAAHGSAVFADRDADEFCRHHAGIIKLQVPQCERALQQLDAMPARPISATARIGVDDIQTLHADMAAPQPVAQENLHLSNHSHIGERDESEDVNAGIVEDCAPIRQRFESEVANLVVRTQLQAVDAGRK